MMQDMMISCDDMLVFVQWLHWPSVFHIFGSMGILWFLLWEWQAASSPSEDDRCSQEEREMLATTTTNKVTSCFPLAMTREGTRLQG